MFRHIELQRPREMLLTASESPPRQPLDEAVDLSEFAEVTAAVRIFQAVAGAPAPKVYLATAMQLYDDTFDTGSANAVELTAVGKEAVTLTKLARYVRWQVAKGGASSGTVQFSIDLIAKRHAKDAREYRLQDAKSVAATEVQIIEEAVDLGEANGSVVVALRLLSEATTGTLILEHAAVLEEDAFMDSGVSFDIGAGEAGFTTTQTDDLLRFVRWSVTALSGTAEFQLDLLARQIGPNRD